MPVSRRPSQVRNNWKERWCLRTGTPFQYGAPCLSQRTMAACHRSANPDHWLGRLWHWRDRFGANRAVRAAATLRMLRGSSWMCGLPSGCTSPWARSGWLEFLSGVTHRAAEIIRAARAGWPHCPNRAGRRATSRSPGRLRLRRPAGRYAPGPAMTAGDAVGVLQGVGGGVNLDLSPPARARAASGTVAEDIGRRRAPAGREGRKSQPRVLTMVRSLENMGAMGLGS